MTLGLVVKTCQKNKKEKNKRKSTPLMRWKPYNFLLTSSHHVHLRSERESSQST